MRSRYISEEVNLGNSTDSFGSEFVESSHDPNSAGVKYMIQISDAFKNAGVVVPST